MNRVNIKGRLTRDPEMRGESCILRLAYYKPSGKRCYITAIANGKLGEKLARTTKNDMIYIDGKLSGFNTDKWKTYLQIYEAEVLPKGERK